MILRDYWFCWVCTLSKVLVDRVVNPVFEDLECGI